jgi:hypothetical protein
MVTHEIVTDVNSFPYCCVGRIVARFSFPPDSTSFELIGTGFLVNKWTVVTATSNVIDIVSGRRAGYVSFSPGYSNSGTSWTSYILERVAGPTTLDQPYTFLKLSEFGASNFSVQNFGLLSFPTTQSIPLPKTSETVLVEVGYPNAGDGGIMNGEYMIVTSKISVTNDISVAADVPAADVPNEYDPRNLEFSTNAKLGPGCSGSIVFEYDGSTFNIFGIDIFPAFGKMSAAPVTFGRIARWTPTTTYMMKVASRQYFIQLYSNPNYVLGSNLNEQYAPTTQDAQYSYSNEQAYNLVPTITGYGADPETNPLSAANFPARFSLLSIRSGLAVLGNTEQDTSIIFKPLYQLNENGEREPLLNWNASPETFANYGFRSIRPQIKETLNLTSDGLYQAVSVTTWGGSDTKKWRPLPVSFTFRVSNDSGMQYALTVDLSNQYNMVMKPYRAWDDTQHWRIVFINKTYFYIINWKSRQYLTWTGQTNADSLRIKSYPEGDYSLWSVGGLGDNQFAVCPAKDDNQLLDVLGQEVEPYDGAPVGTYKWSKGGTGNQRWYFCCFDTHESYNIAIE